eukprot:ctg_174.g113
MPSSSRRAVRAPHAGHATGGSNTASRALPLALLTTLVILGITSPERSSATTSPGQTRNRCTSPKLCSVACAIVTPPICTGAKSATGVSTPLRETCMRIALTVVTAFAAGSLYANAPRGALAVARVPRAPQLRPTSARHRRPGRVAGRADSQIR